MSLCETKALMLLVVLLGVSVMCVRAAPQAEKYEAYEYRYEVKDAEKQLFFDKNEAGDTAGKVTGRYSVWLPDGRLMTIKYVVDKEGGFQPEVEFQDNANPLSG